MNKKYIGTDYGGWMVDLDHINDGDVIISAGCGEDISFDEGILKERDITVVMIDPTPKSISYVKPRIREGMIFLEKAIASEGTKKVKIFKNTNPEYVSESLLHTHDMVGNDYHEVDTISIQYLKEKYNPSFIKMDIEGVEYDILKDCIGIRQICVEFHHEALSNKSIEDTKKVIEFMNKNGYTMIHNRKNEYSEVTFLKSDTPLIFIHKSNIHDSIEKQSFIETTVDCAAHFNPHKKIIFIGDSYNKKYIKNSNIIFKDLNEIKKDSDYFKKFEERFRSIKGPQSSFNDDAIKFLFERFIIIYELLKELNVNEYWVFDTDTLIIDSLAKHENKFYDYDCTEQCNGKCLNGFVKVKTLKKYIEYMLELFLDKAYLDQNQKEFDNEHPNYALTEMRFYDHFKKNTSLKSIDLSTPINYETFDHCLKQTLGPNNNTKVRWEGENGTKKIYRHDNNLYFSYQANLVRAISLNLSWLGNDVFRQLYDVVRRP